MSLPIEGLRNIRSRMVTTGVRHGWVDAAKGISILLVVMVHTSVWLEFAGVHPGPVMDELIQSSNMIRMPLFFFAAGLFATKWINRSWTELANGKLALLLWVFLIWQIAMFAYKTHAGYTLPNQTDAGVLGQLLRVVVAPIRPNAELWFLWALVVFFIAAKAMTRLQPLVALAIAAAVSLAWSGIALALLDDPVLRLLGPGLEKFLMYFVFFLLASLYSATILRTVGRVRWWAALLAFGAWVALFRVVKVTSGISELPGVLFASQWIGLAAGVCAAVLLARVTPLRALGERTLPVYVTHTTFIVLLASVIYATGVGKGTEIMESVTSWLVLAIAVGLGLCLFHFTKETFLFRPPGWFSIRARKADAVPAAE